MLQRAVHLHQAGRLAEASAIYDKVLRKDPRQGDALNLKSVIALDQGNVDEALQLSARAVAALPAHSPARFNHGNALAAAGRGDEALDNYRRAIALDPTSPNAYLNAGVLLENSGRLAEAIAMFRAMTTACPQDARGHQNLALCLVEALQANDANVREGVAAEAAEAFARGAALAPEDPRLWCEFANLQARRKLYEEAIPLYAKALELKPDWPEALSNMGEALRQTEQFAAAVDAQRRAAALRPDDKNIRIHLANALAKTAAFAEAEEIFGGLIADGTCGTLPGINLGNIYHTRHQHEAALTTYENALLSTPADEHKIYGHIGALFAGRGWHSSAHVLLQKAISAGGASPKTRLDNAVSALTLGRLREGWPGYEHRFDPAAEDDYTPKRPTPPRYWAGEDLAGKSILVWTEQGLGDEIIYSSMIPDIATRARACVIACSKRLEPIFARSFPDCAVVGFEGQAVGVTGGEQFDYQSAVSSLGLYLRPDISSFPKRTRFLNADPAKTAARQKHYRALARGRRIVGLSWRSSTKSGASAQLLDLAPILTAPEVFFVNLQYGDCRTELAAVREQLGVDVYQDADVDPLVDMDMFFAQVAATDLVITTSNTTAHVAGAQGIPVWILLPSGNGMLWYWFLRRHDSVWYPSARLFRPLDRERQPPWYQSVARQVRKDLG